ncbi:MAG: lytic transglycosylase domain-containing protein, partial [Alphaproteobacteria bacterium]|nr:lytic transglycosylase domain-containing protein [Alphaproteobacteria bacterium]
SNTINMKKIIFLLIACVMPVMAFASELPSILTDADASIYAQIFDLQSREKIDAAMRLERQLTDSLLMNEVLYQRYISKTYHTRGKEIAAWMNKYYDMPGAERMVALAKIKKATVRSAKLPRTVTGTSIETAQSETWTQKKYTGDTDKKITQFKRAIRSGSTKTARLILQDSAFRRKLTESDYGRLAGRLAYIYYTNGEYELAKKWGFVASDADSEYGLWTMGLLYFKEEKFRESQKYFSAILDLPQINNARKIEAAFWAGRAADANDDRKSAKKYWSIAAAHPMAFYGALSATMLGERPRYEFFEQDCNDEDMDALRETKYGKMALALLQVGQKGRAEEYLKLLITSRASDRTLHAVNSVATVYGLPRVSIQASGVIKDRGILEIDDDIIYSAQYPLPDWEPMGGWSIDRALLLAITKQESGFKTNAKSTAGANGLMQLMPGTAKLVARQNKMKLSDIDMSKPEHNMFLGQQHIVDLLAHPNINNNIIKMLASYNAGMGTVVKFEKSFETSDPLLYIESFPAYETRGYIKRVMSNLWLYRARLNQPLTSMEELADGHWPLYNSEDEYVQKQIADRMSI